jgi:hypothetical protein
MITQVYIRDIGWRDVVDSEFQIQSEEGTIEGTTGTTGRVAAHGATFRYKEGKEVIEGPSRDIMMVRTVPD